MYCAKSDVTGLGDEFTIPATWPDADVDAAINAASRQIDTVCRNHFEAATRTYIVDGTGAPVLSLANVCSWPILTITSVYRRDSYAASDTFDAVGTLVEDSAYCISRSRHALKRVLGSSLYRAGSGIWTRGTGNYRVIGTFGHSATPPTAIVRACTLIVRERIVPGTLAQYEQPIREEFPDGYAYTLFRERAKLASSQIPLTGYRVVDALLRPFVDQRPLLGVAGV